MFSARYELQIAFSLRGSCYGSGVSRRLFNPEARLPSKFGPCEICGGQNGTATGFSQNTSLFLVRISPPVRYRGLLTLLYTLLLPERQISEAWEPSKKQWSFGYRVALDKNVWSLF